MKLILGHVFRVLIKHWLATMYISRVIPQPGRKKESNKKFH